MNTKEIKALESYFKTENEHWNGYTFNILNEVLKQGNFENPETPLLLFSKAIDIFTEQYETPLQAIQNFGKETDKSFLGDADRELNVTLFRKMVYLMYVTSLVTLVLCGSILFL